METKENNYNVLKSYLEKYKQQHLLKLYEENQSPQMLKQLLTIDYELLNRLYLKIMNNPESKESYSSPETISKETISPLEVMTSCDSLSSSDINEFNNIGYESIYKGEFALFLLAGGQGSRLGFEAPKGIFNVQMPSDKNLFEYIFSRVLAIQNLSKSVIENRHINSKENGEDIISLHKQCKILVQTSEENHQQTIEYLKNNNIIDFDNMIVFSQDMIPAIDTNGKIIIKNKNEIFTNPNGNGGCFSTLKNNNILELCNKLGIKYLHVNAIDNPLIKALDPLFIGWHIKKNSLFSAKYIEKVDADEKVGVFLKYKGTPYMLDYGVTPKEIIYEQDEVEDYKLKYRAANILNYIINVDHLSKVLHNKESYNILLNEYNSALKSIKSYEFDIQDSNESKLGNSKKEHNIKEIKGYKFEIFFNSIFQFCPKNNGLMLFETKREEEFSPIKNNEGDKSPESCRSDMSRLFYSWLEKALVKILVHIKSNDDAVTKEILINEKNLNDFLLEIDFSLSYDGENLKENLKKKYDFKNNSNDKYDYLIYNAYMKSSTGKILVYLK